MIVQRPRRLRSTRVLRDLVAETVVNRSKLIMPYFVMEGRQEREPIGSMPGIDRVSVDNLMRDMEADFSSGIRSALLFGVPECKDDAASGAYDPNGAVQKAVREMKKNFPEIIAVTDVCLCEYMTSGHCGIVRDGKILNDPSLELLSRAALSHAEAGADIVAPSDMMDGRVADMRDVLDENGFTDVPILSYSAKYASAFYGPFREAAGSAPQFGDRKSYQMDCRNAVEALKEVSLDLEEGADIVMVKPALSYLDIIARVRAEVDVPVCAYNVSGEYAMVKLMAREGFGDEKALVTEILTSIFRAGADMVISYHARDVFRNGWL